MFTYSAVNGRYVRGGRTGALQPHSKKDLGSITAQVRVSSDSPKTCKLGELVTPNGR